MKLFLPLIVILCTFCSNNAISQGYILTSLTTNTPTITNCDPTISINIFAQNAGTSNADFDLLLMGNNYISSTLNATVNWGDGTVTQHTGSVFIVGGSFVWNPPIEHTYANTGAHNISIVVTNPQNNSTVSLMLYFLQTSCPGTISALVELDCDNNGIPESTTLSNVPLVFSGANNFNVSTNTTNGFAIGSSNASPGNYLVSVDANWLNTNNYVVSGQSDVQMTIGSTILSDTALIILNCAGTTNNLCISGTAYCDANANGILDAGENVFANVPLTITNNGTNYLVYTNANGFYSLNYPGTAGSPTVVMVNGLWMSQNNCTTQSFATTVLASACGTPNTLNIPFICTTCNATSMCASVLVFCDANGNGNFDSNESPLMNVPVSIYSTGNISPVTIYTDSTGFATICGNYFTSNLVYAQINQQWFQQNGYTGNSTIPVQLYPSNIPTPNTASIAINCSNSNNSCDDLWTTITPWIGYYQNTTAMIRLNFGNNGPGTATSYSLTLSYPIGVTPVLSSINIPGYTISGNTISWNLTNASPGYTFTDFIQFLVPSGIMNTTQHYYTSSIVATGSNTDCNYANNDGSLLQIVGNSYDPNDKSVNHPENIYALSNDTLTYTIRFQNTGSAPAQNIHIIDTLSANLDLSTFEVLYTTHPMHVVDLGNGIKKFEFPQIWLPDSTSNEPESHGQIVYRIVENFANPVGSEIWNTAHIYFDWNPAIVTNSTYNINVLLGLDELNSNVNIFPNPANDYLYITCNSGEGMITLFDLSGKEILKQEMVKNFTLDISSLNAGIYMINIQTPLGNYSKKLVIN
jgi:uncharacterized repeat protein (TIGR01451 family)